MNARLANLLKEELTYTLTVMRSVKQSKQHANNFMEVKKKGVVSSETA